MKIVKFVYANFLRWAQFLLWSNRILNFQKPQKLNSSNPIAGLQEYLHRINGLY